MDAAVDRRRKAIRHLQPCTKYLSKHVTKSAEVRLDPLEWEDVYLARAKRDLQTRHETVEIQCGRIDVDAGVSLQAKAGESPVAVAEKCRKAFVEAFFECVAIIASYDV